MNTSEERDKLILKTEIKQQTDIPPSILQETVAVNEPWSFDLNKIKSDPDTLGKPKLYNS